MTYNEEEKKMYTQSITKTKWKYKRGFEGNSTFFSTLELLYVVRVFVFFFILHLFGINIFRNEIIYNFGNF